MRHLRRAAAALAAWCAVALGATASAQATYLINSTNFTTVSNAGACVVGNCGVAYATTMNITGTVTFAAPLAPNLVNADVGPQITSYSLTDGQNVIASTNPIAGIYLARVTTNGSGLVTAFDLLVELLPGPPYPTGTPADPNSRLSYVYANSVGNQVFNNLICTARGGSSAASPVGACAGVGGDGGTSFALGGVSSLTAVDNTVPTLSEWAMIALTLMLAGAGFATLQRRGSLTGYRQR